METLEYHSPQKSSVTNHTTYWATLDVFRARAGWVLASLMVFLESCPGGGEPLAIVVATPIALTVAAITRRFSRDALWTAVLLGLIPAPLLCAMEFVFLLVR